MKKLISIALAAILVLALSVTAFAYDVPGSAILSSAEGPATATGWWYGTWMDADQKVEFANALYGGEAKYIVVAYEGELVPDYEGGIGHQAGFMDETGSIHLFHFNHPTDGQVANSEKIEYADGVTYIFYSAEAMLTYLTNAGLDFSSGTNFDWYIGAPDQYPLVGLYVVKDAAVEAPVEDTPVEDTPVEETPVEETPAETGLALAVVPMIMAVAAIVVSKKR